MDSVASMKAASVEHDALSEFNLSSEFSERLAARAQGRLRKPLTVTKVFPMQKDATVRCPAHHIWTSQRKVRNSVRVGPLAGDRTVHRERRDTPIVSPLY